MKRLSVMLFVLSLFLATAISACNLTPEFSAAIQSSDSMSIVMDRTVIEPPFDNSRLEDFNPTNFSNPTNIDNLWMSLTPGKMLVLDGTTTEEGEDIPRRIEFTVTDLTKTIEGVETVVAWILDYADGELVEAELAFYAQDDDGNVWYLGEYPAEYEEEEFAGAPTWISGMEGAKAGIAMLARPTIGSDHYPQGWAPEVEWSDRGWVQTMEAENCVEAGCYPDVLVIDEFSWEEVGAFQQKYYARGVGNIRVGFTGDDLNKEVLELIEHVQLDEESLAKIRAESLELEAFAYEESPGLYGQTKPMQAP